MTQSYQNPFSIWTFISLFDMEFYFPYLLGPLFLFFKLEFYIHFPLDFSISFLFGLYYPLYIGLFSFFLIWTLISLIYKTMTFISLFYLDFCILFLSGLLNPFSVWTFFYFFLINWCPILNNSVLCTFTNINHFLWVCWLLAKDQ